MKSRKKTKGEGATRGRGVAKILEIMYDRDRELILDDNVDSAESENHNSRCIFLSRTREVRKNPKLPEQRELYFTPFLEFFFWRFPWLCFFLEGHYESWQKHIGLFR